MDKKHEWFLYTLKLTGERWYVGITKNPTKRIGSHFSGDGAKWTRLHKPISVVTLTSAGEISNLEASKIEDYETYRYASRYGLDRVRGGFFSVVEPKRKLIASSVRRFNKIKKPEDKPIPPQRRVKGPQTRVKSGKMSSIDKAKADLSRSAKSLGVHG